MLFPSNWQKKKNPTFTCDTPSCFPVTAPQTDRQRGDRAPRCYLKAFVLCSHIFLFQNHWPQYQVSHLTVLKQQLCLWETELPLISVTHSHHLLTSSITNVRELFLFRANTQQKFFHETLEQLQTMFFYYHFLQSFILDKFSVYSVFSREFCLFSLVCASFTTSSSLVFKVVYCPHFLLNLVERTS